MCVWIRKSATQSDALDEMVNKRRAVLDFLLLESLSAGARFGSEAEGGVERCVCRRQWRREVGVFLSAIHLCPQTLLFSSSSSSFLFFLCFPSETINFSPRGVSLELKLSALNAGFTAGLGRRRLYNRTTDTLIHDTDAKSLLGRRVNGTASHGFSCLHHPHLC